MRIGVGALPALLRAALASVLFAMFAAVAQSAPSLLTFGTDVPAAVTLAALALVFAAVVIVRSRSTVLVVGGGGSPHLVGDEAAPVLPGRATDPVHHPLRPRAPGLT
jgi:hypothetical protein